MDTKAARHPLQPEDVIIMRHGWSLRTVSRSSEMRWTIVIILYLAYSLVNVDKIT